MMSEEQRIEEIMLRAKIERIDDKMLKNVCRFAVDKVTKVEKYQKIKNAVHQVKMQRDIDKDKEREERLQNKIKVDAALKRSAEKIINIAVTKN